MKSITPKEHQNILTHWNHVKETKLINYDLLIKIFSFFFLVILFFVYRQYILAKNHKKLFINKMNLERLTKELQHSHDTLSKLTQNMPGVATQFQLFPDGHATFPYASSKIVDIYGVTPEDIVNDVQPAFNNVHTDDLNMLDTSIKESAKNMSNWHLRFRVNLPHKGMRWIEGTANPEKLKDGSILWHGYLHDITKEKNQFELYKQQVLENKILIETTLDGFWIIDEHGNIMDSNSAYSKMSGYSKDELTSMRVSDIEVIESQEDTELHIQKIMDNGTDSFDTVHRKKDGTLLNVNITVTYVKSSFTKFITSIRDITETKKQEKAIKQLAYFDKLTNLPNRFLLSDRMEYAIKHSNRYHSDLAVCMLDLDGFKEVNDSFGHDAGDRVLVEAAKRITKELREDDTVARLGGDEFVILLANIVSNAACSSALERILNSLSQPYLYDETNINSVSASIGVTMYQDDKVHPDTLLRHADIAMYKSKNSGKNRFTFFDTQSQSKAQETSKILQRIKKAIDSKQFCLYYQPKYETTLKTVDEVEALVRWQHPILGLLSPSEFLPTIQSDDALNLYFDQWLVNEMLKQLMLWNQQDIKLKICLNISPKQFRGNHFQNWFFELIESEKIPKKLLQKIEFEIIETAVIDNIAESNKFIRRLQKHGISFALDDFGTGYSSLIHLRNLHINTIKIDQLFVKEMFNNSASMNIVKAVITLSKAFDLRVTAEGAETLEHVEALVEMGCTEIQGYAISKPLRASEIDKFTFNLHEEQNKNTKGIL